jgi:putative transferase (TIGR04331 family)
MFHLALSNNKNFWNSSTKNIYFGTWMMPDILQEKFSSYDFIIPDWPWDNVDEFYNDSLKVWDDYENFISKLAQVLNEIHGLNWSLKAWKILIGPWLRRYLTIIYEKNKTISALYNSYDIKSCFIKDFSLMDLQLKDMRDFSTNYHKEEFNNIINIYLLKKIDKEKKIKFQNINLEKKKNKNNLKTNIYSSFNRFKNYILPRYFNIFLSLFIKNNDYYVHTSYFKNKFELIKFNLKLGNFPYFRLFKISSKDQIKFDSILRKKFQDKIREKLKKSNEATFEDLLIELIFYMFPRNYLENFKINIKFTEKIFNNFNPKIIIDSVGFHKDELFKFWVAQKIQKNTKLILLQHGGYYEQFKFKEDFLDHELDIADKYLSWGWKKKNFNISPISCQIPFKKSRFKKDKNLVNIILRTAADYFFSFSTSVIPSKNSETYVNDVIKIANNISRDKKLRIFLHPSINKGQERGFTLKTYLQDKIVNKNIEFLYGNLERNLNFTDLNIFTYLGTPYLQAITSNIPCLVYNNEKYEPLNEEYRSLYDLMIKRKLMHTNILSLTNKIDECSLPLIDWWNLNETIVSRDLFCENFSRKNLNVDQLIRSVKNK